MQTIQFREIRNFSNVLSATALFLRQHGVVILKDLLKIIVLITVIEQLFLLWRFSNESIILQVDPETQNLPIFGFILSAFGFLILCLLISVTYVNAYIMRYISDDPNSSEINIWLVVRRRIFPLFLSGLVTYILLVIGLIVVIIPVGFISAAGGPIALIMALVLFIAILYFSAIFIYLPSLVVVEDRNPFTAIADSFRLVNGNWWITMSVWIVSSFIVMVYALYASTPLSLILNAVITNSPLSVDTGQIAAISTRIDMFIGYFIYKFLIIIPSVASTFLYFSIIEKRELIGLREKISALAHDGEDVA